MVFLFLVRKRIEELFNQAMMGNVRPKDLHKELNDWNLFEEYQDRFFLYSSSSIKIT